MNIAEPAGTKTFETRLAEARQAMRLGNLQAAADAYGPLLAEAPNIAELHFERGVIAQLGRAPQVAEQDYRNCLRLDPAHLRARENLGQLFRNTFPPPGFARSDRAASQDAPFVYVVGSSYVRSFSSTTLFLPLWLGPANELSFINDEAAARTQAHLLATIARCDRRNPVLLVMGNNDPIVHADNLLKTKDLQATGALGSHAEIVEAAALRYMAAIQALLEAYPDLTLWVLGACLMFSAEHNEYVRMTNSVLRAQCDRLGIPFFDLNDRLTDPATGNLRVELASHPTDTHLSKQTSVELVGNALRERGLLPAEPLPFEWSFLWQTPITDRFQVRIWGEPHTGPSNLVHSKTVAFNHVVERALHVLLGSFCLDVPSRPSVLVPYCHEGLVPLTMPNMLRVTGLDDDPASILMARRLAHYFGRNNAAFYPRGEKLLRETIGRHDFVFVALRDEVVENPSAFIEELMDVCGHTLIVLSTVDWSSLPSTPSRMILPMKDATTRPPWDAATILIQRRS